jgi:hypothetical protein
MIKKAKTRSKLFLGKKDFKIGTFRTRKKSRTSALMLRSYPLKPNSMNCTAHSSSHFQNFLVQESAQGVCSRIVACLQAYSTIIKIQWGHTDYASS